jgi:hypothetical protein
LCVVCQFFQQENNPFLKVHEKQNSSSRKNNNYTRDLFKNLTAAAAPPPLSQDDSSFTFFAKPLTVLLVSGLQQKINRRRFF